MRCIVCNTTNQWKNVDDFRLKKEGMAVCGECGFISYPDRYKTKEEIRSHYKDKYRNAPNVGNLYTGERKLHLHNHFLRPFIEEWKKQGKTPHVFEIGSAYGLFLNWFKHEIPSKVEGSEWDLAQKRNAFHEFGLELVDDIDPNGKYDLIVSYRVLEHQIDADKELETYFNCLNDDGYFYISVPTWFERLQNHGDVGFDIEQYFSPNHINTWHLEHVQYLFERAGFEVVEHNKKFYDHTFMLKKGTPKPDLKYPKVEGVEEKLKAIKEAYELYGEAKFKEATKVWPNFPHAYRAWYESNRKQFHPDGYEQLEKTFLKDAINNCPNSFDALTLAADIAMRYSKWDRGIAFLSAALNVTPESPTAYMALSHCYRHIHREAQDLRLLQKARDICRHVALTSSQFRAEAITWAYQDNANLPSANEMKAVDKKDPGLASNAKPFVSDEGPSEVQAPARLEKSKRDNNLSL